jgi:hypothetical protein
MKVTIMQPIQQPMQRGNLSGGHWLLECDPETRRYPEPLMGWTASGDTLNQVRLNFKTLDEAKAFAERKGWDYTVEQAHVRTVRPRTYIDNFKTRGDRE